MMYTFQNIHKTHERMNTERMKQYRNKPETKLTLILFDNNFFTYVDTCQRNDKQELSLYVMNVPYCYVDLSKRSVHVYER